MYLKKIESTDPRLGRHVEHDPRSKAFALAPKIDKTTWTDKSIRVYDPVPNPNQTIGNCTAVAKCVMFNAVGNRRKGVVLNMDNADTLYEWETANDSFPGTWPPDDTGSSGLAAAKAAQHFGLGGTYRFLFGGADEVVQAVMDGRVVNVGTEWENDMFEKDAQNRIHLGGGTAGGHEWSVRGYWKSRDWLYGKCWWGDFAGFWISRADLDSLLRNDGDAHVQDRA